jgi:hypothetical protein
LGARKKKTPHLKRFSTVPPCYEEDLGSFIAMKGGFVCQLISLNIE